MNPLSLICFMVILGCLMVLIGSWGNNLFFVLLRLRIWAWGRLFQSTVLKKTDYSLMPTAYLIWVIRNGNWFMRNNAYRVLQERASTMPEYIAKYIDSMKDCELTPANIDMRTAVRTRADYFWDRRCSKRAEKWAQKMTNGTPRQREIYDEEMRKRNG